MSEEGTCSDGKAFAGRWTPEEEAYTDALIHEFRAGTLEGVEEGATLRNFLADAVGCHAKRISKKYEGTEYNGRQQFWRNIQAVSPEETKERRKKLEELKRKFEESRSQSIERAARMKTKKRLRPTFIPPKPNRKPNSSRPKKKTKSSAETGPLSSPVASKLNTNTNNEEEGPKLTDTAVEPIQTPSGIVETAANSGTVSAAGTGNGISASASLFMNRGPDSFPTIANMNMNMNMNGGLGLGSIAGSNSSLPPHLNGNLLGGPGHGDSHGQGQLGQSLLNPMFSQGSSSLLVEQLLGLSGGMNMNRGLLNGRVMAEENRKRQLLLDALSLAKPPPSSRSGKDP